MESEILISVQELSRFYGQQRAIENVSFDVHRGEILGFLGPNGAGKTTTVRILSGLLRQTSGTATVCGFDIDSSRDDVKGVTGLLPESPGLYSKLSAVEFLEFIGALNGKNGETLNRRIDSLLGMLGLEGRQDDLLESYSSGMKQKVLVASTLLHEPKLVFLDEPTSRLDPAASALVKDLILALAEETDTSFFICTHQTSFAEDVCDMIGILNEGELVVHGAPNEIIDNMKVDDLEDAYLKVVGGHVDREALLAWR